MKTFLEFLRRMLFVIGIMLVVMGTLTFDWKEQCFSSTRQDCVSEGYYELSEMGKRTIIVGSAIALIAHITRRRLSNTAIN